MHNIYITYLEIPPKRKESNDMPLSLYQSRWYWSFWTELSCQPRVVNNATIRLCHLAKPGSWTNGSRKWSFPKSESRLLRGSIFAGSSGLVLGGCSINCSWHFQNCSQSWFYFPFQISFLRLDFAQLQLASPKMLLSCKTAGWDTWRRIRKLFL